MTNRTPLCDHIKLNLWTATRNVLGHPHHLNARMKPLHGNRRGHQHRAVESQREASASSAATSVSSAPEQVLHIQILKIAKHAVACMEVVFSSVMLTRYLLVLPEVISNLAGVVLQEQASTSATNDADSGLPPRLRNPALLRRLTACQTANEALDIFLQDQDADNGASTSEGLLEVCVRDIRTISINAV